MIAPFDNSGVFTPPLQQDRNVSSHGLPQRVTRRPEVTAAADPHRAANAEGSVCSAGLKILKPDQTAHSTLPPKVLVNPAEQMLVFAFAFRLMADQRAAVPST